MSGNRYLLDTNIVLYLLSSENKTESLLFKKIFISFITELELFSYPSLTDDERESISFFLSKTKIVDIMPVVKSRTIFLRQKYRLKLPDAIICATAWFLKCAFVTNDKKLVKINEIKTIKLNAFITE